MTPERRNQLLRDKVLHEILAAKIEVELEIDRLQKSISPTTVGA